MGKVTIAHMHNEIPAQNKRLESDLRQVIREMSKMLKAVNFTEPVNISIHGDYISLFSRDETKYFLDYTEWEDANEHNN